MRVWLNMMDKFFYFVFSVIKITENPQIAQSLCIPKYHVEKCCTAATHSEQHEVQIPENSWLIPTSSRFGKSPKAEKPEQKCLCFADLVRNSPRDLSRVSQRSTVTLIGRWLHHSIWHCCGWLWSLTFIRSIESVWKVYFLLQFHLIVLGSMSKIWQTVKQVKMTNIGHIDCVWSWIIKTSAWHRQTE